MHHNLLNLPNQFLGLELPRLIEKAVAVTAFPLRVRSVSQLTQDGRLVCGLWSRHPVWNFRFRLPGDGLDPQLYCIKKGTVLTQLVIEHHLWPGGHMDEPYRPEQIDQAMRFFKKAMQSAAAT